MIKGLYTAASGMVSILTSNDNLADSLANVNTPGFKQGVTLFKSFAPMLIDKISSNGNMDQADRVRLGGMSAGCALSGVATDFSPGPLRTTDDKYDFAIQGNGFFEVQTDNGEKLYTRNGSFQRSADGYLETAEGHKVMGADNKPIILGPESIDFEVDSQGMVMVNKQAVNQIKVVDFENNFGLMKRGSCLYTATEACGKQTPSNSRIMQGALEGSNANVISTMVSHIEGMRAYETLAKVIETANSNLEKSTNQLGRV
jgi:flagellar basal-body rod protein FlgG